MADYIRAGRPSCGTSGGRGSADGLLRVDGPMLANAASALLSDRAALTRSLLGGPDDPDAEPPQSGWLGAPPQVVFGAIRRGFGWRGGSEGPPALFAPDAE